MNKYIKALQEKVNSCTKISNDRRAELNNYIKNLIANLKDDQRSVENEAMLLMHSLTKIPFNPKYV